jgi:hypothetical protein
VSIGPKTLTAANDKPKPAGLWGTILTTTPIVLTILATIFSGLSSSELNKAMYYRSLATQHQSKVGDQWSFFQSRRIRGTEVELAITAAKLNHHPAAFKSKLLTAQIDQLLLQLDKTNGDSELTTKAAMAATVVKTERDKLVKLLKDAKAAGDLEYLDQRKLPSIQQDSYEHPDHKDNLAVIIDGIDHRKLDSELALLVAALPRDELQKATSIAEKNESDFNEAGGAPTATYKRIQAIFEEIDRALQPLRDGESKAPAAADRIVASLSVASLDYDARRYRKEADLNRKVAQLYEVWVRSTGIESDRHRERSYKFFFSMLIAQLGVVVASLALAKTQQSSLWLFAACAGLAAIAFSTYVFLST